MPNEQLSVAISTKTKTMSKRWDGIHFNLFHPLPLCAYLREIHHSHTVYQTRPGHYPLHTNYVQANLIYNSISVVLNQVWFDHQRTFDNVCRHFWLIHLAFSVMRPTVLWYTHKAQAIPSTHQNTHRNYPTLKMSAVLKVQKLSSERHGFLLFSEIRLLLYHSMHIIPSHVQLTVFNFISH
jgi:hypothetical protein